MSGSFQVKRFNWTSTPSAWQQMQTWKAKRSQMVSDFQAANSAAADAFASAQTDLASGMATLAAQASITRSQQELKAKTSSIDLSSLLDVSA